MGSGIGYWVTIYSLSKDFQGPEKFGYNSVLLGSATKESEEIEMHEKEEDNIYGGTTKKTSKALMIKKSWD